MTQKEQQELEDENSKLKAANNTLKKLVNNSSVESVKKAIDERNLAQSELKKYKKDCQKEIRKANKLKKTAESEMFNAITLLKRKSYLHWNFLAFILICTCIKSKSFIYDVKMSLIDILQIFKSLWYHYYEWLSHPSYPPIKAGTKYFTGYVIWGMRIMAVLTTLILIVIIFKRIFYICRFYKNRWCTLSLKVFVISLTIIFIFGEQIKKYLPVNLFVSFIVIQLLYLCFLKYMDSHYEAKGRFDYWDYIQHV